MRKLNQNGFSGVEVLLVLIFLAIVGFAGYYVYHAQKKPTATHVDKTAQTSEAPANSDVFTSDDPTAKKATVDNQLVFKYPHDWTLTQTAVTVDGANTTQDTKVTAPSSSTYVEIKRQTGGIGGAFCTDGDNAAYNLTDLGKHTLTDYNDFTLVVGYSSKSGPLINVTSTANANQLQVGNNSCQAGVMAQLPTDLFSNSDGGYTGAQVKISNAGMDAIKAKGGVVSESDYNTLKNSTDFSTAITIVQTIKKL